MEHRFRFTGCYLSLFSEMLSCFVCVCSERKRGAGSTCPPRRSSPCTTIRSWRVRAGWGAAAAQRTPGTEAARCCWKDSSPPRTHLQFVPSVCVFCSENQCHHHQCQSSCDVHVCSVSLRVFSLNVPLASKTLVALIYKPSAGITISLELKTTDASLCTHLNAEDVKRELLTPATGVYPCCNHFSIVIITRRAVLRNMFQLFPVKLFQLIIFEGLVTK